MSNVVEVTVILSGYLDERILNAIKTGQSLPRGDGMGADLNLFATVNGDISEEEILRHLIEFETSDIPPEVMAVRSTMPAYVVGDTLYLLRREKVLNDLVIE